MWTLQHNLTADLTKHRRYYRDLLNNKTLGGFYILPRWRFLQCLCRIGFKPFVFSGEIDTTLWEGGGKRRRTRVFRSHAVEPVEARLLLSATVTDDSVTGPAGLPITIDVLANDSSSDGASLLITALGEPQMAPWKLD